VAPTGQLPGILNAEIRSSWMHFHTFATRLYRKMGDLYLVQRALGHRQITTTEVYARVGDDALRAAVAGA